MRLLFLLFLAASIFSCRNESPTDKESINIPMKGIEDFETFYHQFHADSLYQLEHIIFPMEGLPSDADSVTIVDDNFRWQKENWVMHRAFDSSGGDFKQEFTPINEMLIIERITHVSGGYGMVRRFAKLGDDWYLIYYAGMNRIQQKSSSMDS